MITCFVLYQIQPQYVERTNLISMKNSLIIPTTAKKYIFCKLDHTFSHEDYVAKYEDGRHVFYRARQSSGWNFEVECAVQERKSS